jgi:uncharacterized protein YprB with RNaseH-like and TPR domain
MKGMLRRSFIFLPGIGISTERSIWASGVFDWQDFLKTDVAGPLKGPRKERSDAILEGVQSRLERRDIAFFKDLFRPGDNWRLWEEFGDGTVFLDIETTGTRRYSPITVVGLFDGSEYKALVRGKDLSGDSIREALKDATMLVTFNGATFDLPMIEARFPGTLPDIPHLDLRFLASRCGYSGGLKKIEISMGISRPDEVKGMSGEDAVRLWKLYERDNNRNALKLLLKYNMEDILNLEPITLDLVDMISKETMK